MDPSVEKKMNDHEDDACVNDPKTKSPTSTTTSNNKKKRKNKRAKTTHSPNNNHDSTTTTPPKPPPDWDRCHAYMAQKRRFCRQLPNAGSSFCGNHLHLLPSPPNNTTTQPQPQQQQQHRIRIPCPIDPSHWIYQDMVNKHKLICPKAKQQKQQEEADYYCHNINTGGYGDLRVCSNSMDDDDPSKRLVWAQQLALRVLEVHEQLFFLAADNQVLTQSSSSSSSSCGYHYTWQNVHDAMVLQDYSQPELKAGMSDAFATHRIRSGGVRHVPQLASLVGHLRAMGALEECPLLLSTSTEINNHNHNNNNSNNSNEHVKSSSSKSQTSKGNNVTFLELGAGRGMLGLVAAGVSSAENKTTRLIMVERAGTRGKADKIFRGTSNNNNAAVVAAEDSTNTTNASSIKPSNGTKNQYHHSYLRLDNIQWSRVTCDLAHISVPIIMKNSTTTTTTTTKTNDSTDKSLQQQQQEEEKDSKVFVIAKHLCGAGTDLALKSLESMIPPVDGCLLATCCHGICDWKHYVGRDYLSQVLEIRRNDDDHDNDNDGPISLRFGPAEFDLMRRWCAGSVACTKREESQTDAKDDQDDDNENNEHKQSRNNKSAVPGGGGGDDDQNTNIANIVQSLELKCGIKGLGRACQRLIDYGRREYLCHRIFPKEKYHVDLCHYVPPNVTPQNAVLVASRHWR